MEADPQGLVHRNAFNVTAMQLAPERLAEEIRKHLPAFEITYEVDPVRQSIALAVSTTRPPVRSGAGRRSTGWPT